MDELNVLEPFWSLPSPLTALLGKKTLPIIPHICPFRLPLASPGRTTWNCSIYIPKALLAEAVSDAGDSTIHIIQQRWQGRPAVTRFWNQEYL
jgi:hypothetical protein